MLCFVCCRLKGEIKTIAIATAINKNQRQNFKKKNSPEYLARMLMMSLKEAQELANSNWHLCWLLLTTGLLKLEHELRGENAERV